MIQCHKRSQRFTLIELLIVIAVIAMLAALLLPALAKARYRARLAICMNNMKQQGLGLMMYTSDFEDFYPMASHDPISTSGDIWTVHANNPNDSAARPKNTAKLIRPYWGGSEDDPWKRPEIEQCPVAFDLPTGSYNNDSKMSYMQYWGRSFSSLASGGTLYGTPMKKLDDYYICEPSDPPVNVLISDIVIQDRQEWRRYINHHDMKPDLQKNSSYKWTNSYQHVTKTYLVYQTISGHYGSQDGSVAKYTVKPAAAFHQKPPDIAWLGTSNKERILIPLDFVKD